MPMEFDGHTATQVPHWMQRSAWITPASSSQNQTLPGGSAMPFICSRDAVALHEPTTAGAPAMAGGQLRRRDAPGPGVERLAGAALRLVAADQAHQGVGDAVDRQRRRRPSR